MPSGADAGKYLECNGQWVNPSLYPKLAALMSYTPNYQGAFLRGYGSQYSYHYNTVLHSSANLGELQGDAIRNITGTAYRLGHHDAGNQLQYSGALKLIRSYFTGTEWGNGSTPYYDLSIDASLVVPIANENRPINKAVKFLIKAK